MRFLDIEYIKVQKNKSDYQNIINVWVDKNKRIEVVKQLMLTNKNFNMKKFFCEIIQTDIDGNDDHILGRENCDDRLRELTKRIRQKEIKKRTLGKCPVDEYLTH